MTAMDHDATLPALLEVPQASDPTDAAASYGVGFANGYNQAIVEAGHSIRGAQCAAEGCRLPARYWLPTPDRKVCFDHYVGRGGAGDLRQQLHGKSKGLETTQGGNELWMFAPDELTEFVAAKERAARSDPGGTDMREGKARVVAEKLWDELAATGGFDKVLMEIDQDTAMKEKILGRWTGIIVDPYA